MTMLKQLINSRIVNATFTCKLLPLLLLCMTLAFRADALEGSKKTHEIKTGQNSFFDITQPTLAASCCHHSHCHSSECSSSCCNHNSADVLAQQLVESFWRDVQQQNVAAYSKKIATQFQGLNLEGIYDKSQQVQGLSEATLTTFQINHLRAARYGNTLQVAYDFLAEGEGIVSGPSLDTWRKERCGWKLIAHAYVPFLQG